MKRDDVNVLNKSETWIKQSYAITVAKHNFNVHEMRVMTRITQALQKDMKYGKTRSEVSNTLLGDKIIHIPTQTLLTNGSQNHTAVKRALKSLGEKSMLIRGKDKYGEYETRARLIMKYKYYLNNEMVEIQLDRDILPDYLALASYSRYIAEVSFNSPSRYIMRIYQFISHWKDKTKKVVTLDELRDVLELGDKYNKPKDIRKHVLEPCISYLKTHADVWFEIDKPTKAGRSITGYVLKIYTKNTTTHNADAHQINIQHILKNVFGLRDYHLDKLRDIINKPEYHPHIYEKLRDVESYVRTGKVENIKAYVVKTIQSEFGDNEDDKTYNPPGNIRQQLQEDHNHEIPLVEDRSQGSGLGSMGEQIEKIVPQRPTE
jgi:plasmid replication initiation protein